MTLNDSTKSTQEIDLLPNDSTKTIDPITKRLSHSYQIDIKRSTKNTKRLAQNIGFINKRLIDL